MLVPATEHTTHSDSSKAENYGRNGLVAIRRTSHDDPMTVYVHLTCFPDGLTV
jgi:hypothetical protein